MTRRMLTGFTMRRIGVLLATIGAAAATVGPHPTSAQQPGDLHIMPVRGNVFIIVGGGSNVTVSAGVDGMLLVDAGSAAMADKVLEKVMEIGRMVAGSPAPMTTCVGPSCYPAGSPGPFLPFGWAGPSYNAVIASPKASHISCRERIRTSGTPPRGRGCRLRRSRAAPKRSIRSTARN